MSRISPFALRRVFAIPAALLLACVAGLVLGLTGDGLPDLVAWILVGLAPLVMLAALLRGVRRPARS